MKRCRFCRRPKCTRGRTECPRCQSRRWRAANPVHAAFILLRQSATRHHHPFNLTLPQFTDWCESTGYINLKGRSSFHCDRIDPDKGYEIGNIRLLSASENSRQQRPKRYVILGRVKLSQTYTPEPDYGF